MIPFQSYQTHNIIFFGINSGFAIVMRSICGASHRFDHDLFRTLLISTFHRLLSIFLEIFFGSILFCFSNDSQIKNWSIKFFSQIMCTQTLSFFFIQSYANAPHPPKTVLSSMFSFLASHDLTIFFFFWIFWKISSTFSIIGRTKCIIDIKISISKSA